MKIARWEERRRVQSCWECPFVQKHSDGWKCHKKYIPRKGHYVITRRGINEVHQPPRWCPLEEE